MGEERKVLPNGHKPGTMVLSDFLLVVLLGLMTKQALLETGDSSYLDDYNLDSDFGLEVHEDPFEVSSVDGPSKRRLFNGGSKGLFKLFSKRNPFVQRKHFMEKGLSNKYKKNSRIFPYTY